MEPTEPPRGTKRPHPAGDEDNDGPGHVQGAVPQGEEGQVARPQCRRCGHEQLAGAVRAATPRRHRRDGEATADIRGFEVR